MDIDASFIAAQTTHDQAAPELPIISEDILTETTCPVNTDLPDPSFPPKNIAQKRARETAPTPSSPIPATTSIEGAIVSGLKDSLVIASQSESRLRELSTQAEVMKTNMHVSTYVSSSPTGFYCQNSK